MSWLFRSNGSLGFNQLNSINHIGRNIVKQLNFVVVLNSINELTSWLKFDDERNVANSVEMARKVRGTTKWPNAPIVNGLLRLDDWKRKKKPNVHLVLAASASWRKASGMAAPRMGFIRNNGRLNEPICQKIAQKGNNLSLPEAKAKGNNSLSWNNSSTPAAILTWDAGR